MKPLMNENIPSKEEQEIRYIGSCTYDHFLNWLADARDFVMTLNEDVIHQLETMIIDQVLSDKGLPNDLGYFQANPNRPWFKHAVAGDMEYLIELVRGWRKGSEEPLDLSRWRCEVGFKINAESPEGGGI